MSEPTPRPWFVDDAADDVMADWGRIKGADGYPVANACMSCRYTEDEANEARRINFGPNKPKDRLATPPTVLANANLIVKAVNAHDQLVAALEMAIGLVPGDGARDDVFYEKAHAALAKAKGET